MRFLKHLLTTGKYILLFVNIRYIGHLIGLNPLIIFGYVVFTKSTSINIRLIHIMHDH